MIPNEFTIKTEHFQFSGYGDEDPSVICSVMPDNWTGCENGLFTARNQKELMDKLETLRSELRDIIHDIEYADIYDRSCWNLLPRKAAEPETEVKTDG